MPKFLCKVPSKTLTAQRQDIELSLSMCHGRFQSTIYDVQRPELETAHLQDRFPAILASETSIKLLFGQALNRLTKYKPYIR